MKDFKIEYVEGKETPKETFTTITEQRVEEFSEFASNIVDAYFKDKIEIAKVLLEEIVNFAQTPTEVVYFVYNITNVIAEFKSQTALDFVLNSIGKIKS